MATHNTNPPPAQLAVLHRIQNDRVFMNNPVMLQGLGLAPIVVADTSCRNAVMLIAALALLLVPTRVLTVSILTITGNRGHYVLYPFMAALIYIPAYLLLLGIFSTDLLLLGLYLPILVVDPLIINRNERTRLETITSALKQGISTFLGAAVVVFLMGAIREFLATGCLFEHKVYFGSTNLMPLANQPSGGFILLGLICAIWRYAANIRKLHLTQEAVWK